MRLQWLLAAALALTVSACSAAGTNQNVPPTNAGNAAGTTLNDQMQPAAVDMTSVLKQLTKEVTIGSTVDPTNGDKNPHGLVYVTKAPIGQGKLAKGDLATCNYSDSSGVAGNGTTVEYMPGKSGSNPSTLSDNVKHKGCADLVLTQYDQVYTADATAKNVVGLSAKGSVFQTIANKNIVQPWSIAYMASDFSYPPGNGILTGDLSTGKIIRIDLGSNGPGPTVTPVISGFATGTNKAGDPIGPTALQYNKKTDTLYVFDAVTNTLVSVSKAYEVLNQANAIVVSANGKSFTGPRAKNAHLVYAGKSLNVPAASALLPNGNLIVANSGSAKGNWLVEITSDGKILANKNVDKGKPNAVYGIVAAGSTDSNTTLYFTDDNTNNVRLLTR